MRFDKKALSIEEQILLLRSRGLLIDDSDQAAHYLSNISYYRLSAYWYTFLQIPQDNHVFKPNSHFQSVIDTYIFDRKLRLLVFDEVERIEIALRTQIIYHFSNDFGPNWYENKDLFRKFDYYKKFNDILYEEMNKSNEVFIRHYKNKYTHPLNPPAWMALELTSFGQLSTLYKNLKMSKSKKAVADHFGLHDTVLTSWLESLSYLRNTCAHHSRLWNKKLPKPLMIPEVTSNCWLAVLPKSDRTNRVYLALAAIAYLLSNIVPNSTFNKRLDKLISEFPSIPVDYMGFPLNWRQDPFWKLSS